MLLWIGDRAEVYGHERCFQRRSFLMRYHLFQEVLGSAQQQSSRSCHDALYIFTVNTLFRRCRDDIQCGNKPFNNASTKNQSVCPEERISRILHRIGSSNNCT